MPATEPPIFRDSDREPFVTLDGSTVRELVQTGDGARAQSLAEATVPAGGETIEHLHRTSEEIYRFVSGQGRVRVGAAESRVGPGDTVLIAPGTPHKLRNPGPEPLVLLCCSAPPYADADTELLE
jgi:mannose-6-phosphate isomerase-like protein (cupin superfamily)